MQAKLSTLKSPHKGPSHRRLRLSLNFDVRRYTIVPTPQTDDVCITVHLDVLVWELRRYCQVLSRARLTLLTSSGSVGACWRRSSKVSRTPAARHSFGTTRPSVCESKQRSGRNTYYTHRTRSYICIQRCWKSYSSMFLSQTSWPRGIALILQISKPTPLQGHSAR